MSLVGTRPPTLDEWEKYELHHRARLAIKPGMLFCHRMNRIIYKRTLGSDPLKYFKLFILTKLVLYYYKNQS